MKTIATESEREGVALAAVARRSRRSYSKVWREFLAGELEGFESASGRLFVTPAAAERYIERHCPAARRESHTAA